MKRSELNSLGVPEVEWWDEPGYVSVKVADPGRLLRRNCLGREVLPVIEARRGGVPRCRWRHERQLPRAGCSV